MPLKIRLFMISFSTFRICYLLWKCKVYQSGFWKVRLNLLSFQRLVLFKQLLSWLFHMCFSASVSKTGVILYKKHVSHQFFVRNTITLFFVRIRYDSILTKNWMWVCRYILSKSRYILSKTFFTVTAIKAIFCLYRTYLDYQCFYHHSIYYTGHLSVDFHESILIR